MKKILLILVIAVMGLFTLTSCTKTAEDVEERMEKNGFTFSISLTAKSLGLDDSEGLQAIVAASTALFNGDTVIVLVYASAKEAKEAFKNEDGSLDTAIAKINGEATAKLYGNTIYIGTLASIRKAR